jgi:hypothetical protein
VPRPQTDLAASVVRISDVGARTFALWRLTAAVAAAMADVAHSLSEKEITSLAHYLAHL